MVGLSHRALRSLILEFGGLDYAFTEMTSAGGLVSHSQFSEYYLDAGPTPETTVIQLLATGKGHLVEAAARIRDLPVLGIDLNFGCAAPHIKASGGGVAWMSDPEGAADLVASARSVWPRLLSAKLRIGGEENYPALKAFCDALVEAGLDFITLHPRLENEKLRRSSRWEYIGRLASALPIPVIGNGDLRSPEQASRALARYAPAGLMIGREAARRPWIFSLIKARLADPGAESEIDMAAVAARMLDLIEQHLPREFHLTRARRFFFYFADNFSFAHHIKWQLQNAADLPAMRSALAKYFTEVPGDRIRRESPRCAPKQGEIGV